MSNIIERMQKSIDYAIQVNGSMDDVSWVMQEGILLSYNEAIKLIRLYQSTKEIMKWSAHFPQAMNNELVYLMESIKEIEECPF
jgi:shikimate kinase